MPKESSKSKQAKKEIQEELEKIIGSPLDKKSGKKYILYSKAIDTSFYLRFSKNHSKQINKIKGWYYIPSDYSKLQLDNTFFVFLLENFFSFFVPVTDLLEAIKKDGLKIVSDNTYKLHIDASDKNSAFFIEMPNFNLQQYSNQLGLQYVKSVVTTDVGLENKKIEDLDLLLSQHYIEGNIREVLCNQYERDPQARRKCVEIHGLNCHTCGFNFQKIYGDYGENFIHIHHLVPISKIGNNYKVNPEKDLIPLCANCHAIVHRVDPPYTPEKVREVINLSIKN